MMNHIINGLEPEDKKLEETKLEEGLRALKEEYMGHGMTGEQIQELRTSMAEAGKKGQKKRFGRMMKGIAVSAAVLAAALVILPNTSASVAYAMGQIPVIGRFIDVVTFRDYQYESDRNMADINVPEIRVEVPADGTVNDGTSVSELDRTVEEINAEIREITERLISEFEEGMELEGNYQDLVVESEVLLTTPSYFTLKLICYQGAGSGYQWNYYYTVDLNTGKRLALSDIFTEDSDYLGIISDNIKEQMREQMAADENVYYWLEDEITEWNFVSITDDTSFYINADNHVVIAFDEGEVAPMYMGTVEFEIPDEVLDGIRREAE